MGAKLKIPIGLSNLKKLGVFQVTLEGEIHKAPFSRETCVWYDWLYRKTGVAARNEFTHGTRTDSSIIVRCTAGDIEVFPSALQPYLTPSFQGEANVEGKKVMVEEFCLESGRTYYAMVEKFTFSLPPLLFIPRRRSTLLLELSDERITEGRPAHPLIPTYRGRTG